MKNNKFFLFALASLALPAVILAQVAPPPMQSQPAPIQRDTPANPGALTPMPPPPRVTRSEPAPGVWVRSAPGTSVTTISATADKTELRVDHGVADVEVHHPAPNSQILVDLPGGQVALIKDGFYTFNAGTNTARVLQGEADAFVGASNAPIVLKEDHAVTLAGSPHATGFAPQDARGDILSAGPRRGPSEPGFAPYPYTYGYPYYPYPYYAWGYPYGYPFGFGLGFGYYGGWGFGGYRGFGFRR